ncbi:MAG: hypothetical protein ACRYG8_09900 [Janthinobacterium lividum]
MTRTHFADDQLSLNNFDDVTRLPQITANGTIRINFQQIEGFELKSYYSIKTSGTFLEGVMYFDAGCG